MGARLLWFMLVLVGVGALRAEAALEFHGTPGGRFSDGVTVEPGATWYFPSGVTAGREATGNTEAQALACMAKLKDNLAQVGLGLGDVVHVRAYLVPDATGQADFAGWNAAWDATFPIAAFPQRPARTSLAVPQLGSPNMKIEVEFVCAVAKPTAALVKQGEVALRRFGDPKNRIASGVGVAANTSLYWTAGIVPGKEGGADTREQARTVLKKLQANLATAGLSFADVVYLRCFVAPDPAKEGRYDLEGWNAAYDEFFNTAEQPHKPARTTVTAPSISPGSLLEVELLVAAPKTPSSFDDAAARTLVRYGEPTAAISSGVAVHPAARFHFASGTAGLPGKDTKMQAMMALTALKAQLARDGLKMEDVVFLRAYLVPEPDGTIDRKGWNDAYALFFKGDDKPARTSIPVVALPAPQMKIEIDVIAARR